MVLHVHRASDIRDYSHLVNTHALGSEVERRESSED